MMISGEIDFNSLKFVLCQKRNFSTIAFLIYFERVTETMSDFDSWIIII